MRIQLTRRLGQNQQGTVIERSDREAHQLILGGFAVHVDTPTAQPATAASEDSDDDPNTDQADTAVAERTEELARLKGDELKDLATRLGVPTYGTKHDLAARIATVEADTNTDHDSDDPDSDD